VLEDIFRAGNIIAPRGKKTRELIAYKRTFDMSFPLVTIAQRRLGYKFACAEAAWILSGDDRVETIAPYSKRIAQFSDDGERFFGAYGPKIQDQMWTVVDTLVRDRSSRQAVINIWRENPRQTKDVPCTVNLQFLIRGPYIHTVANMRSSDAWLGWPYDVFNFTMVTAQLMLYLQEHGVGRLTLGTLTLNAGSEHLYEENWDDAMSCIGLGARQAFTYRAVDPYSFSSPDELVKYLWSCAETGHLPFDAEVIQ
jgi:thymidylate synthase